VRRTRPFHRTTLAVAASLTLASAPARADDEPAPIGMHYEERTSRPLFWTGFGLTAFGYLVPTLAFTGGALADASMRSSSSGSSSSWSHDAAPWLVPYAGPFLYLNTHPNESAFWPVTFLGAQIVGTGLLVASAFVTQRKLVPGEGTRSAVVIRPQASRDGGGVWILGAF
jgi:hypothetical protein